jgi:hypothetical protein
LSSARSPLVVREASPGRVEGAFMVRLIRIMSFFKIEKSGCTEHKGLLQVRYDLFWDETEERERAFVVRSIRVKRNFTLIEK